MTFLAEYFGFFVLLAIIVAIVGVVMVSRRISSGAVSAGPLNATPPPVYGLTETAFDLRNIDLKLETSPCDVAHLLRQNAADVALPLHTSCGPTCADEVDFILAALENHLELTPLQRTSLNPFDAGSPLAAPSQAPGAHS